MRACTTQRRNVSGVVIPSSSHVGHLAVSLDDLVDRSTTKLIGVLPGTTHHTQSPSLRARQPRNEHCIRPGVAQGGNLRPRDLMTRAPSRC